MAQVLKPTVTMSAAGFTGGHLFLVVLLSPFLGSIQTLAGNTIVPRDKLDLKVPGDGHQRRLDLIVLDIVSVWRLRLTCHDFVGR